MGTKAFLSANEAAAHGVRLAKPQVIAAYPITPQTTLVEKLADFIADGQSDARYMMVESEHSAMAAALGASMMGARTSRPPPHRVFCTCVRCSAMSVAPVTQW